jgi:transglutaminase-like putative cysteine protease
MRLAIEHLTTYHFAAPIRQGLQRLRLTPVAGRSQTVIAWDIECDGGSAEVGYDDENVNRVTLVGIAPGARSLTIRAHGLVETSDENGVFGRHQGYLPLWHYGRDTALTKSGAGVAALVAGLEDGLQDRLATLHALTARVREAVVYEAGHTDVATTAEAALTAGHGVCQDQAHVFIAAARTLGIPARYVSGYLLMDASEQQEAGHGWAEGFVEGLGWVGFDVANAVCPDDRYVRVASGRDYDEAAPIKGVMVAQPVDEEDEAVPERLTIALTVRALDLA